MRKKAEPKKKEESEDRKIPAPVTPPRDITPHYDERYSSAPTPSRSPSYRRRSGRLQELRINASPSRSDDDKLLEWFSKKLNIREEDKKPSAKSYGKCLVCWNVMYEGDVMALGCGHILCKRCGKKIYYDGDKKCPECRLPGVFAMLMRPEPPTDTTKVLKKKYLDACSRNVLLSKKLTRLEKEKDYWENEARQLWDEFVTDEIKQYPWFKKRAHNYS